MPIRTSCAPSRYFNSKGVTMIEVLVSMLVLSIGLLGAAGLQSTSLRSNQSAYLRTQATAVVYDIMDRMRTNPDGVAAGNYNNVDTATLPDDPACIDTSAGCNAAGLADHDIRDWALNSLAILPSSSATVVVDDMGTNGDASDDVFVVTLNWADFSIGVDPKDLKGLNADQAKALIKNKQNQSLAINFQL